MKEPTLRAVSRAPWPSTGAFGGQGPVGASGSVRPTRVPRGLVYFVLVLSVAVLGVSVAVGEARHLEVAVVSSFAAIGLFSAYQLAHNIALEGMSLRVIFWFFNLFFFSVAPVSQFLTNNWHFRVNENTLLVANLLILLYLGIFSYAYRKGQARAGRSGAVAEQVQSTLSYKALYALALASFVSVLFLLVTVGFDWDESMVWKAAGGDYGPMSSLLEFSTRPFVFFVFLFIAFYVKYKRKRSPRDYFFWGIAAFSALLMNFPTTSARFYVFATFFGLMILLYPPRRKNTFVYLLTLILGIYGAYWMKLGPEILSSGRPLEEISRLEFSLGRVLTMGNFDSYEMFVHSVDYVSDEGAVLGRQLLGVFLFWVPRSLWPDKPIGTGAFVAADYLSRFFKVWYTNVSAPLIEEAYVNFALPGIVLFSGLLGYSFGYFDVRYRMNMNWLTAASENSRISREQSAYFVLYPVLVGHALFVLRGDLLSGFAYACSFAVAFLMVSFVVQRRSNPLVSGRGRLVGTR